MDSFDLLIVGGGINGAAIARDGAIRGAKILLVERDDLASHTSSASSKLIHGGLRYLEYREFRLVREALKEREILLRTAPHIVRPLRFVLPAQGGSRPWWMLRAGLLLYDLMALRGSLPSSRAVRLGDRPLREPLASRGRLLSYWDAAVDDSRLTVLNAVDAAERGAEIATRTELLAARREGEVWIGQLSGGRTVAARAMVNAAGPWVGELLERLGEASESRARLVKGSHIAVPRLWTGDHAYILPQPDGRVVFALPFQGLTLLGTTEVDVDGPAGPEAGEDEALYLCSAANLYFERKIEPSDVVWRYSGVRALYDDGAADSKAVTRDYHLELSAAPGARLLSVFGGKITTARALAEAALDRLEVEGRRSTASVMLPGGDLYPAFVDWLEALGEWIAPTLVQRLMTAYGTRLKDLVGDASSLSGLGRHFGVGLYEREVRWLVDREFARNADDILWRRTKLGLRFTPAEHEALERYLASSSLSPGGRGPG